MGSLTLTLAALAVGTASAQAASSINVSVSVSPVAGRPITVAALVNIDPAIAYNNLFGVYLLRGGSNVSCPSTDPGNGLLFGAGDFPAGPETRQQQVVLIPAGSYLVCGYLDDATGANVLATSSAPFRVRGPHESVRISGPRRLRGSGLIPRVTGFRVSFSSESPRNLYVVAGFGRSCGRNVINTFSRVFNRAGGEIHQALSYQVSGNGKVTYKVEVPLRGTYVVCAFVGTSASEVDAKARFVFHVK